MSSRHWSATGHCRLSTAGEVPQDKMARDGHLSPPGHDHYVVSHDALHTHRHPQHESGKLRLVIGCLFDTIC